MRNSRWIILLVALAGILALLLLFRGTGNSLVPKPPRGESLRDASALAADPPPPSVAQRATEATSGVESKTGLAIHVGDQTGRGIEGASVASVTSSPPEHVTLGTTDPTGILRLTSALACPARIAVSSAGFVGSEIVWESMPSEDVWIKLQAAPVILGRVVSSLDGNGIGGVRILAWSDRLIVPAHDIAEQAMHGVTSRGLLAVSRGDGAFDLSGVSPSCTYSVIAAGNGWASFETISKIQPGEVSLVIQVGQLYGTRIRLEPDAGIMVTALSDLAPPCRCPVQPNLPGATHLFQPSHVPVLAGLRQSLEYGSLLEATYLFVSSVEVDAIGPLPFTLDLPGFEPIETQVRFPRAVTELHETVIALHSTDQARGHCVFRLLLPDAIDDRRGAILGGGGAVYISALDPPRDGRESSDLILNMGLGKASTCSVDVPVGAYMVRYSCIATGVSCPGPNDPKRIIDVGPTEQVVEFDLRSCGGIKLTLTRPDGTSASGGLSLMLCKGGVPATHSAGVMTSLFMADAPYVIAPLAPGAYGIIPLGHSSMKPGEPSGQFDVKPGEWTAVTISLADS